MLLSLAKSDTIDADTLPPYDQLDDILHCLLPVCNSSRRGCP